MKDVFIRQLGALVGAVSDGLLKSKIGDFTFPPPRPPTTPSKLSGGMSLNIERKCHTVYGSLLELRIIAGLDNNLIYRVYPFCFVYIGSFICNSIESKPDRMDLKMIHSHNYFRHRFHLNHPHQVIVRHFSSTNRNVLFPCTCIQRSH